MDIGTLFAALIGGGFVLAAGRFERRDASKARREERTIIREFASRIQEAKVDEMSEQSFPASDPPPSPTSIGGEGAARSA